MEEKARSSHYRVQDHARGETIHEESESLCTLFRGYIASAIISKFCDKSIKILDLGCGISRTVPRYIGNLAQRFTYVGLDPIDIHREREYLFILGTVEALPLHLATEFDLFVFATSLDHLENIPRVAGAIRQIAGRNALGIFLVGLHDTRLIAEKAGREDYRAVFRTFAFLGVCGSISS